MVTDYFEYNGKKSTDFDIEILEHNAYSFPKKEIKKESIPGRDGDIIYEQEKYENISIYYDIGINTPYAMSGRVDKSIERRIKSWLCSSNGYGILRDTYNLGFFRKAAFYNGGEISNLIERGANQLKIVFDCKPHLYAESGTKPIIIYESSTIINNPYCFKSLPIIAIRGIGNFNLYINDHKFIFKDLGLSGYIKIDSENYSCYHGAKNLNSKMSSINGEFPVLEPGKNVVKWELIDSDSQISQIDIYPNWRCI